MEGIAGLLPSAERDADGPAAGTVFKIERGPTGEKVAYVRVRTGTLRVRERLELGKVTALALFDDGAAARSESAPAGRIAKVWGLGEARIGDPIGETAATREHHFPPPTLESVVSPLDPGERARLRVALNQLAEQDPLIDVRQDDVRQELSVSLYGEVQKEVIQATLADDFGLDVSLGEATTICVERPTRAGVAVEILNADSNPFRATIGLRVEPGSGVDFKLTVDFRLVPLYVYRTVERFAEYMAGYVDEALREGLHGWQVTDCLVTMVDCNYSSPDGSAATRGPLSAPADYRKLTPLVLAQALERARTVVCEPIVRARLEVPTTAIGAVMSALERLGAPAEIPTLDGNLSVLETVLSVARAQELQRQLPKLTGGEGVLETEFGGYEPVIGEPPTRPRTTPNPLNREEYLMHLAKRV